MKQLLLLLASLPGAEPGLVAQDATTMPPARAAEQPAWAFDLSLYQYFVPDDENYLQPTLTADRGPLHLEARYNYEDLGTASVWAGWNLGWGDELSLELTPMVGLALGDTEGVALGYRGTLDWWKLELYSEGEYLHDLDDSDDSFLFSWSELTLAPVEWLRAGLVVQRTRVYESDLDIQRGFVLGLSWQALTVSVNCFNPDQDEPIWLLALELGF